MYMTLYMYEHAQLMYGWYHGSLPCNTVLSPGGWPLCLHDRAV